MTTPKPARPDTLQAIVAEMRGPWLPNVDVSQTLVRAWAIRIEAIAASAPQADALLARLLSAADRTCGNTLLGETSDLALAHLLMDAHDALAASAQVRAAEPLSVCADYPNCPNLGCGPRCDRNAKADPQEGHSDSCHAMHPGDRECNCHKAYGFDTAEDMQDADEADRAAAEPAPVAQGADSRMTKLLSLLYATEGRTANLCFLASNLDEEGRPDRADMVRDANSFIDWQKELIDLQHDTIADHARRESELLAQIRTLSDGLANAQVMTQAAEASLAACRAVVVKWRAEDSIMPSEHFADELGNALHQEPKP